MNSKKFKRFRLMTLMCILLVNIVFILLLVVSSLSSYINPAVHPKLSLLPYTFPVFLTINLFFLFLWLFMCRFKAMLFPLVGLILCASSIRVFCPVSFSDIPAELTDTISFISYNTMSFGELKKDDNGENQILEYLKNSGANIICLQEYATSESHKKVTEKDIRKALKEYPYYRVIKVGGKTSYTNVACFSKFRILSAERIPYESAGNGSAVFKVLLDKDTILIVNNHLESNKMETKDKEAYEDVLKQHNTEVVKREGFIQVLRKLAKANAIRAKQADVVSEYVDSSECKYKIVCGDFNDIPLSYTHRVMCKYLKDAFAESGTGLGISYNQHHFYFHIDNILVSQNIDTYNCHIDYSIKDSDHYPIRCIMVKRP